MNDKPLLSRVRHKRAQERSRQARSRSLPLPPSAFICAGLLWALLLLSLHLGRNVVVTDLSAGQPAPSTLQASVDFETTDLAATALRRERVLTEVPPVLVIRESGLKDAERTLLKLLDRLGDEAELRESLDLLGLDASLLALRDTFTPDELERLKPALMRRLQEVWNEGLIAGEDRDNSFGGAVPGAVIRLGARGPQRTLADFPLPTEAAARAADTLRTEQLVSPEQASLLEQLLAALLQPNLVLDATATRLARQAALQAVEPVTALRRQGAILLEARMPITEQQLEDLRAHQQKLARVVADRHNVTLLLGQGIFLAIGLAVSLAVLCQLQRDPLSKTGRMVLWMLLSLGGLWGGKFLIYLSAALGLFPGHLLRSLLPLALGPLLGTILHGPRMGIAVGFASSLALALQHELDMTVLLTGLVLAHVAALSVRAIHRRSTLFRAGLWIGGVKALLMIGAGAVEQVPPSIYGQQALAAFGSGLLTSLVVLLLIPPFEYLFKVTTDIRLLELSDMGHPLLSRLAMEAPGTYHHSLMVANLAQAAAREIGANDLLTRVCAYYHDIGKLTKPEFFIENIQGRANPHDELSPSMSRLIVISHVKEGVSLAHRYKLPQIIIDGIEQHHGTSVIQYFYHRARTRAAGEDGASPVRAEDYRYPGPKPRSREMGILLLADAIEAASRSIDRNKPGQIESLVHDILREKLNDGQLDQCQLTLAEVNTVRRSFLFSLNNMLHGRVAYPKDDPRSREKTGDKDEG